MMIIIPNLRKDGRQKVRGTEMKKGGGGGGGEEIEIPGFKTQTAVTAPKDSPTQKPLMCSLSHSAARGEEGSLVSPCKL